MRQHNLKPLVLLALNTGDGVARELRLIRDALCSDTHMVKVANGCYKGQRETSYLVQIETQCDYLKLMQLARDFNQESIMLVDNERQAQLMYCDNEAVEPLGRWKEVMNGAPAPDSFTEIDGRVFVTTGGCV